MDIQLIRTYGPRGTNGQLYLNGRVVCYTIELPWNGNRRRTSCIPEGRYPLVKRYSARYGWHFEVCCVEGRSYILLHPANDALRELKGCIAPVSQLIGEGRGLSSRMAMDRLKVALYPLLDHREKLYITILNSKS